jgi:hypothetical protein
VAIDESCFDFQLLLDSRDNDDSSILFGKAYGERSFNNAPVRIERQVASIVTTIDKALAEGNDEKVEVLAVMNYQRVLETVRESLAKYATRSNATDPLRLRLSVGASRWAVKDSYLEDHDLIACAERLLGGVSTACHHTTLSSSFDDVAPKWAPIPPIAKTTSDS